MRVLVATRPFYGHLNPMLPVARALCARGHEVRVATNASLAGPVAAAGLPLVTVGADPRQHSGLDVDVDGGGGGNPAWRAGEVMAKTVDLVRQLAHWRPDVIIREQTDFGALLYGEMTGIPVALLGPALWITPHSWAALYADRLDRVRQELGVTADPLFERINPWLYLDPAPTPYQHPSAAAIAVRHETQPVPVGRDDPGPRWLADLPRRSTVYLTLGTVFHRRPNLLRTAATGLLRAGCTAVVSTGPRWDPDTIGLPQDARLHTIDYLPQGAVLPHCAAVVSHGGFGSVLGALWYGLPQLVVPLGSDNPNHAARVVALGVGERMAAAAVTEERIEAAVTNLLADRGRRAAAAALGRRVRAMPTPEEGAELVERLVATGAPVRHVPARHRSRPRIAVVVPVLGRADLTRAVLDDIAREPWVDPVVVDNAGDHVPVHGERVLTAGRNLGWAGACDLAMEALADDRYDAIVLLNNDTRLSPGFFAGLWAAYRRTGAALLGPVYDGTWPHQQSQHAGAAGEYRPRRRSRQVPFLDGTCLFVPRRTAERVGRFDLDAFPSYGWGIDLDYALRVRADGGSVHVCEDAFLHHEGGATASREGEAWKLAAWQELMAGMRARYGLAWPRLLRDRPEATVRHAAGRAPGPATCPPVVMVGTPGSAAGTLHRALNLLGLPPAHEADQTRLDRIATTLGLDCALPFVDLPAAPEEVLGAAALLDALEEIRRDAARTPGELPTQRPALWIDRSGGVMIPFWAAAYDVNPLVVLSVRGPFEAADEIRAETRCDPATALAVWERRTRLALRSIVGVPVLVTAVDQLLADDAAWANQALDFVTGHGVPLLRSRPARLLASPDRRIRPTRFPSAAELTREQVALQELVGGLDACYDVFPDLPLPEESPATAGLLSRAGRDAVPRPAQGRLRPEWADWVRGNRRAGVPDSQLLGVLVERGVPLEHGRRALQLLGAEPARTDARASYREANAAAWDLLSDSTEDVAVPVRRGDVPGARREVAGPLAVPWEQIATVLCVGAGGGRQAPLFAALGLDVTVLDLSERQLELDRDAARRLGVDLRAVQGDMADLSLFAERRFDLVYQPVSMCYLPDPAAVHREIARVLRLGGHYWVEHWNPVQMQLDRLGRAGPPYRLVRPQDTGRPVRFGIDAEEFPEPTHDVAWHYVHSLGTLLGTLCAAGFEICDARERRHGDPDAPPGSEAHLEAYVPPFFAVLAQRVSS